MEKNPCWGIYEFTEEPPGSFVPYPEFRKECKNMKSPNVSAVEVLNRLSKIKTKEKLVSNFASHDTHFYIKNSSQQIDSRVNTREAICGAGKQIRPDSKNTKCSRLKKPTLPNESNFKIFKSRHRPRLDVQLKMKRPDSTNSNLPTGGSKNVSSGTCLKVPNNPKLYSQSTSSKNKGENGLAGRMDFEICSKFKEIRIETDITAEKIVVEQNPNNNESNSIHLKKFSEEDPNQMCSEESFIVVEQTPVDENLYIYNSSEPEVVYSSNQSEDNVASFESSRCDSASDNVIRDQMEPINEVRNSVAFCAKPQKVDSTQKSSQSNSSFEHTTSEQYKETSDETYDGDFDQLYKRTPLKIEHKKLLTSVKKVKNSESKAVAAFDRLYEEYNNNISSFEPRSTDAEEEKNKVSDSEVSIVSSKASPSLVHSLIYMQRSSESESEEIDETNEAVAFPVDADRNEPRRNEYIPGQSASNIVSVSPEKTKSRNYTAEQLKIGLGSQEKLRLQSRNSIPEQPTSRTISVSQREPHSLSKSSTAVQCVLKNSFESQEKLRSQSRTSTPEQLVSSITPARKEKLSPQPKSSPPEQSISIIVSVSQEKPHSQPRNKTPEKTVSKIVPVIRVSPHLPSKNSTLEQPVSEIDVTSEKKLLPQLHQSKRKKTISLTSSKASKESKARIDKKQVKKLTDFVAFSIRKRHASKGELGGSDNQTEGPSERESPISCESTPKGISSRSPKSHSAVNCKIRKVKKLFNQSEDVLSVSPDNEKPSAKVDLAGKKMCESLSSSRNIDLPENKNSSDSDSSLKLHSAARYQTRKVKKLVIESDDSLLPSPVRGKLSELNLNRRMNESSASSENIGPLGVERSSDSDSSSVTLSLEFKTLSLASKNSSVLFPSQSPKMSPSSTSVNVLDSQATTVSNDQMSAEITLDQIDQMMKGVIPSDTAECSFRFDMPPNFSFKESPKYENYDDRFAESTSSDVSPSSISALDKTLIAKDFPDEYFALSSNEKPFISRRSSNFTGQGLKYSATESTFDENFSLSRYSMDIAPNEDTIDLADGKFSNSRISSFSISKSSVTEKKSKEFSSQNFNDGLVVRRHCLSLPIENKSSVPKYKQRKMQADAVNNDDTSDEDIFRDSSPRSFPIPLKKKSASLSQQYRRSESIRKFSRNYSQNKENQFEKKKKVVGNFQKSPSLFTEKSRQLSSLEKRKSPVVSQKSSELVLISDDDYESDELNSALNDSLTEFNKRKENESKLIFCKFI